MDTNDASGDGKKKEGHTQSAQKRTEKRKTLTDAAVLFLEERAGEK